MRSRSGPSDDLLAGASMRSSNTNDNDDDDDDDDDDSTTTTTTMCMKEDAVDAAMADASNM